MKGLKFYGKGIRMSFAEKYDKEAIILTDSNKDAEACFCGAMRTKTIFHSARAPSLSFLHPPHPPIFCLLFAQ